MPTISEKYAAAVGVTPDEWDAMVEATILESRKEAVSQADILIDAGWRYELPEIVNHETPSPYSTEPWQWYWRSPPKRKGSKGRKYWSTQQALNALLRQRGCMAGTETPTV